MEQKNINNKDIILNENEMENVTGGYSVLTPEEEKAIRVKASMDGRNLLVEVNKDMYTRSKSYYCFHCQMESSTYAREKVNVSHGFDKFIDCVCYSCRCHLGNINTRGELV